MGHTCGQKAVALGVSTRQREMGGNRDGGWLEKSDSRSGFCRRWVKEAVRTVLGMTSLHRQWNPPEKRRN